jgi:hypothetical protein
VIKITSSLKIAGTVNEAGIEANTEGEGTGEGVMYFDYEKGVILGAQMDSHVKNTIKAKGKQEDRILNQDIKTTFILQLKE